MSPNMRAFLDVIAWAEIGPVMLRLSDNGYNVCVGSMPGHMITFPSYAAHPRIRNDMGTPNDKRDDSDAAGRYQFMGRYWEHYRIQLGLRDFGKDSQDRWAIQLIGECKALADVEAGRLHDAVTKCRSRWASFPGAGYGQPEKKMADLERVFAQAGGKLC